LRREVFVAKGQMLIVPKGVEHKTHADSECEIMMFEPETTLYMSDVSADKNVERLEWI
jgi:mannose-6-phosphate isomerase-like protein (cupin superfamily)